MSNINDKWINIVLCIDSSGSMYITKKDVVGGVQNIIDENKKQDGKTTISLFTFNEKVHEEYVGKDINDMPKFEYEPSGLTSLNDGCGTAITKVGKWLYERDKNGEEMPSLTMFVLITDGMENSSVEYTLKDVQDMIKTQTDVYSWQFIYQGCDITTSKEADKLGFKYQTYGSRDMLLKGYDIINKATNAYRTSLSTSADINEAKNDMYSLLETDTTKNTAEFEKLIGKKIRNDDANKI